MAISRAYTHLSDTSMYLLLAACPVRTKWGLRDCRVPARKTNSPRSPLARCATMCPFNAGWTSGSTSTRQSLRCCPFSRSYSLALGEGAELTETGEQKILTIETATNRKPKPSSNSVRLSNRAKAKRSRTTSQQLADSIATDCGRNVIATQKPNEQQ